MTEQKKKEKLEELKNNLTIDQIYEFLLEMGGEPHINDNVIVSRTICHNPPGQGSFKLYYYDNTKLFKCYTQCPEGSFDIFQLVLKIKNIAQSQIEYYSAEGIKTFRNWELPDAISYICNFYGIETENEDFSERQLRLQDWEIFNKWEAKRHKRESKQIVSLNVFDDSFLKNLPRPVIAPWVREGISKDILNIHDICYDPITNGIVIPHRNINNQLIGIRERTLIKANETYGKYLPAIINGKMYNHPLSFNLYNINISKNNIRNIKKAIVFEGEKSCLLYGSYFGIENDISVATCGSNLINFQVELLLSLGVQEIIIAFDRQYKMINDSEWKKWTDKLYRIYNKYSSIVQVSFLFDTENYLDYKQSPIDNGKETFLYLLENRIVPL